MSYPELIEAVAEVGLILTFIPDVLFIILYSRTNWQGSDVGKNLFWFAVVTATVVGLALIGIYYQNHLWFETVRALVYLIAAPTVFWWRLWLLIKYQKVKSTLEVGTHD